jgi:hypothetical protein
MSVPQQPAGPRRSGQVWLIIALAVGTLCAGVGAGMTVWQFVGPRLVASPTPSPSESESRTPSPVTPLPDPEPSQTLEPTPTPTPTPTPALDWKASLESGPWSTSHVQGITVDPVNGIVYYSFTTLLVKTDLSGKVLGTVDGFTGHLGDLAFNAADGRVYGSLEYKDAEAFYIAIFDVDQIDKKGINAQGSDIVRAVYLPEVVADFTADMDGNGRFAGDTANTKDHRYGCSGIDGVSFGPPFGDPTGPQLLTIGYGIYQNNSRSDNDHQVLLQYNISDWASYERPLVEGKEHRAGPPAVEGKYFVYTGNTSFGIQSLDFDAGNQLWLFSVYPGSKSKFPNYSLYAIAASARPELGDLVGVGDEQGLLLPLADAGLKDKSTGIRGWRFDAPYGLQSLGEGRYYLVESSGSTRRQRATLTLQEWTGDDSRPFKS